MTPLKDQMKFTVIVDGEGWVSFLGFLAGCLISGLVLWLTL